MHIDKLAILNGIQLALVEKAFLATARVAVAVHILITIEIHRHPASVQTQCFSNYCVALRKDHKVVSLRSNAKTWIWASLAMSNRNSPLLRQRASASSQLRSQENNPSMTTTQVRSDVESRFT